MGSVKLMYLRKRTIFHVGPEKIRDAEGEETVTVPYQHAGILGQRSV